MEDKPKHDWKSLSDVRWEYKEIVVRMSLVFNFYIIKNFSLILDSTKEFFKDTRQRINQMLHQISIIDGNSALFPQKILTI